MGFDTKQDAYFAWRADYDAWKAENPDISWWYKEDPPQWSDYWYDPLK